MATSVNFSTLPLSNLLESFGDNTPAPGGGSASALAGALAASLARMVGGLTVGKKGYEEAGPEAESLAHAARALGAKLEQAVTDDAAGFDAVMAAMALPKATDEEKEARKQAMQVALKAATVGPLAVARACLEVGQIALRLLAIGNKNACTDAGVAVLLAVTGAEGALLNAAINLGGIKDAEWVSDREDECERLWEGLEAMRSDLWPQLRAHGLDVPRGAAKTLA